MQKDGKSMIIMIDVDNVLNNLQEVVVNRFNEKYGTSYSLNDFTKYNVSECIPKDDAIKMVAMYDEAGIYDHVKPLSGARNALEKLIRDGHSIYIVTHANPCIYEEKSNWVKFHFPCIDKSNIVCMKPKWLFRCDVMIEDKLDTLLNGHHYDRICFDAAWNRDVNDDVYDIVRCKDWNSILAAVNDINNKYKEFIIS